MGSFLTRDIISQGMPRNGVYASTENQKFELGVRYIPQDGSGRVFRYAKNGAVALSKGKMTQSTVPVAHHVDIAVGTAAEAGATQVSIGTTLSTAVTEDQYKGGYFIVNDGTAGGYSCRIKSNTAGTTPTITLEEELIEDVEATDEFSLVANTYNGVIIVPNSNSVSAPTSVVTGVPLADVPANYYCWLQVKGEAPMLIASGGSVTVGSEAGFPSTTSTATAGACDGTTSHPWGLVKLALSVANYTMLDLNLE